MEEYWSIIKGFCNYAVSSRGRVRNLNTGRLLKHQNSGNRGGNYALVNLSRNGKRKNVNVHVLVAEAFLGERPKNMIIHHKDRNRMNPDIDNLEYVTHAENRQAANLIIGG